MRTHFLAWMSGWGSVAAAALLRLPVRLALEEEDEDEDEDDDKNEENDEDGAGSVCFAAVVLVPFSVDLSSSPMPAAMTIDSFPRDFLGAGGQSQHTRRSFLLPPLPV